MDPLPNLNKVFQLVHQSAREKRITGGMKGHVEMSAFMVQKGRRFQNDVDYRKDKQEKLKLRCDYCGKRGHIQTGCFELNGFPDWYKGNKPKGKFAAHVEKEAQEEDESPLDDHDDEGSKHDTQLINAVGKQVMRMYNNKGTSSSSKGEGSLSGELGPDDSHDTIVDNPIDPALHEDTLSPVRDDNLEETGPDTGPMISSSAHIPTLNAAADQPYQEHATDLEIRRYVRPKWTPIKFQDYEHTIPGKSTHEAHDEIITCFLHFSNAG
ncbi:hypothetical protein BVRB_6g150820 [Beta vulgaris subsp. vulgaris]|nr:hypothetical protein BVRB_6g150820 [Beta vulgaris subsp. vulgaris]